MPFRAALILAGLWLGLAGCAAASGDAAGPSHGALAAAVSRYRVAPQPPPGSCRARGSWQFALPDPRCTPGATDPRVDQADIGATICRVGYTRTVRPPEWVTGREKRASLAAYGDRGPARAYEYDHLIPLELGGAPNDPRNLWPQPGASPNPKDRLEDALRARVCEGRLPLAVARREIASDWVSTYRRLLG